MSNQRIILTILDYNKSKSFFLLLKIYNIGKIFINEIFKNILIMKNIYNYLEIIIH